jgi:hypothetical protein
MLGMKLSKRGNCILANGAMTARLAKIIAATAYANRRSSARLRGYGGELEFGRWFHFFSKYSPSSEPRGLTQTKVPK